MGKPFRLDSGSSATRPGPKPATVDGAGTEKHEVAISPPAVVRLARENGVSTDVEVARQRVPDGEPVARWPEVTSGRGPMKLEG